MMEFIEHYAVAIAFIVGVFAGGTSMTILWRKAVDTFMKDINRNRGE